MALINALHLPETTPLNMAPCPHEETVLTNKSEQGRDHIPEIRRWIQLTPHPEACKRLQEELSGKK